MNRKENEIKYGWIYMWTNKKNKKPYIGKTNNKECRYNWFIQWDIHYAGPHIDRARKKYNDIKYWDYQILYETSNTDLVKLRDELDEKEKYFIQLYHSNEKYKGYNISSGGTWGDTWSALSDEEYEVRSKKTVETRKRLNYRAMTDGLITKTVPQSEHQKYLDMGWKFGCGEDRLKIIREASQKYSNSPEMLKQKEETKIRAKQRKIERKEEIKKQREIRNQTPEWQAHITENKERSRQIRIEYNKSEAHRKATIESNKRRWKDGVPEETRNKMKESQRKYWDSIETRIWVSKDSETKMIKPDELDTYIALGYIQCRQTRPWNKGVDCKSKYGDKLKVKLKGAKWMNDGSKNHYVIKEKIDLRLKEGWQFGKIKISKK